MFRRLSMFGLTVVLFFVAALPSLAERPRVESEEADAVEKGRAEFRRFCASCHGLDAKGKGTVAKALKSAPPDLTTIARRNGGRFDANVVRARIDGREIPMSHGTTEMPVWGERFQWYGRSPASREPLPEQRLHLLVTYLKSIQVQQK